MIDAYEPEDDDENNKGEKDWSLDPDFLTLWRNRMREAVRKLKGSKPSSRFDTSDIVQEGMMQMVQQFDSFRGNTEAEFDAWIKKIAKGHTLNVSRFHRAKKRDVTSEVTDQAGVLGSSDQSPPEEASRREMLERLAQAIQKLDDREQTVVMYHMFEELSFAKIGESVGASAATAKRVYDRAIEKLSRELDGHSPDSGLA